MKKILAVMLIAILTVASVFAVANFDKSNLSINYRPVGYHGQLGLSYAYNKAEFGLEVWSKNSILVIPHELVAKGPKFVSELDNLKDWPGILLNSVLPSEVYASAVYEILRTEKSELSVGVGAMVAFSSLFEDFFNDKLPESSNEYSMFNLNEISGFPVDVCGELEYVRHFDAHNALTVRLVLPVRTLVKIGSNVSPVGVEESVLGTVLGYAGIGYRYTF